MPEEEKFVKVNMPKAYHRKLKAIAALKDSGISAYILECLEKVAFKDSEDSLLSIYEK